MDDSGDTSQAGRLRKDVTESNPGRREEEALSMGSLGQALPDYANPSSRPQRQQPAGQAYSPSFQTQLNYQQQFQNYVYQNQQQQRVMPSPLQTQYHGSNMYQGQQPMFYQQYPQSPQFYQGSQRIPEGISHGYGSNLQQVMPPIWSPYTGDPFRPPMSPQRSIPSVPRGPPRKPKQSGHALWVGNLPPGALVNDLKDHFSRDAKDDIESVFLISKSNCAFVNYKTEEACAAAMARFHDSRFAGVRVVCRLRRTSTNPAGSPSGVPVAPAALVSYLAPAEGQTALEAVTKNREESTRAEEAIKSVAGADKVNDKYFIVKSLTIEDLELSARNGIWATQAHNEETLNKAYETVDNVYLIFSANKSGEYFGYARMASPINEESAATLDWKPRTELPILDDPELPRSIPTPATETAPKGRIIDDSARGTIFWEADAEEEDIADTEVDTQIDSTAEETPAQQQPYGHPFRIEWLSTSRMPFYRTRGLRNPWNSNREVKIARDGTELETNLGRRLVAMFGSAGFGTSPISAGMQQQFPPSASGGGGGPGGGGRGLPGQGYAPAPASATGSGSGGGGQQQ